MGPSLSVLLSALRVFVSEFCGAQTKIDAGVEATVRREKIQRGLSIIALARLVDFCLCQHNQGSPVVIPLHLHLVTLEEVLLGRWRGKLGHVVDTNSRWLTL